MRKWRLICLVFLSAFFGRAGVAQFVEVGEDLGTAVRGEGTNTVIGGGVSAVDLDGDGRLDLVVTVGGVTLYHQNPDGTFSAMEGLFEFAADGHLLIDIDSDGDLDALLLGTEGARLYEQRGRLEFVDITDIALPGDEGWSVSAAPADFDGDGDVDLFVSYYVEVLEYPRHQCAGNHLWLNDGLGRFTLAPARLPEEGDCSLAVIAVDYDDDGDPDVAIGNDFGTFVHGNVLLRNDGPAVDGVRFVDVSESSGFAQNVYGMGIAAADINLDGRPDFLTTSIGLVSMVLSRPEGTFQDETVERGAGVVLAREGYQVTWGVGLADFDRDGHLDAIMAGGAIASAAYLGGGASQANVMLVGQSDGSFALEPEGWELPPTGTGRGLALADLDHDGDTDIAIANTAGGVAIHRNDFPAIPPLRVQLSATETHASAIGARVEARCSGILRTAWRAGGGSFAAGGSQIELTFPPPCDVAGRDVELRVRWPSGYTSSRMTQTGRSVRIIEPDWIVFDGDTVRIAPTNQLGVALAGDETVSIGPPGEPVNAVHVGGGTFQARVASSVSGWLELRVGSSILGAHPRVNPRPILRTFPSRPVVGRPLRLAWTGVRPPASGASVRIDGMTLALEPDGRGRSAMFTPRRSGPFVASLLVDGSVVDERDVIIERSVDPSRSFVRLRSLYDFRTPSVTLTGIARDAGGRRLVPEVGRFELLADGERLIPEVAASGELGFEFILNTAGVADGALFEVRLDGIPLVPPQPLRRLAAAADITDYVDPAQSRCSGSMRSMRDDGEDVLHFLVFLRDRFGQPLPTFDSPPEISGLRMVSEPVGLTNHTTVLLEAPADDVAAPSVRWFGRDVGVECDVSFDATVSRPITEHSELQGRPRRLSLAEPGQTALVSYRPRDGSRRLVGSGVAAEWEASLGMWESPVRYEGLGVYSRDLGPGREPGTAFLEVRSGDAVETAEVQIVEASDVDAGTDAGLDSGEDGGVDAGVDAATDTGSSDAARDSGQPDDGGRDADLVEPPGGLVPAGGACHITAPGASGIRFEWLISLVGCALVCRRRWG